MRNSIRLLACAPALAVFATFVVLGVAISAQAETLSNGPLVLEIRADNGAIEEVTFDGTDFVDVGLHVANFGLQWSSDPLNSFRRNTTDGIADIGPFDVTSDGTTITATGRYTALVQGGCCLLDISIVREYWLVPGADAVRTRTTLTNDSAYDLEGIQFYDLFDPDGALYLDGSPWPMGLDAMTIDDVRTLASVDAGISSSVAPLVPPYLEFTSVFGNAQGGPATLAYTYYSDGFTDGFELLDLFEAPNGAVNLDPDGVLEHGVEAVGFELTLGIGESATLQFDHAFGEYPETAEEAFVTALPEPSLSSGLAAGVAGLVVLARWRPRRPVARG